MSAYIPLFGALRPFVAKVSRLKTDGSRICHPSACGDGHVFRIPPLRTQALRPRADIQSSDTVTGGDRRLIASGSTSVVLSVVVQVLVQLFTITQIGLNAA